MSKKSAKRRSVVSKDLTEIKEVVESVEKADSVKDFAPEIANKISRNSSDERFVIKVGTDKWLKSWNNFALCSDNDEAMVLNHDWAVGHQDRLTNIKHMKAEIVKL